MKKITAIILFICLVFCSCGVPTEKNDFEYVEGTELLYIYGSASADDLSDALGKELTCSQTLENGLIPTGAVLYENGSIYKITVVMGDVDCDGKATYKDAEEVYSLAENGTDGLNDCIFAAADINADSAVTHSDGDSILNCYEQTESIFDYKAKKISGFAEDEIIAAVAYDKLEPDFSVYTAEFFGSGFSDCTLYDLYGDACLYIILKIKDVSYDNLEKQIRKLNSLDGISATKHYDSDTKTYTEYVPGKAVHLLNRRYPFTEEYTGFSYDRNYRLIYYYTTNFDDLVTQEQHTEWYEYYKNENGIGIGGYLEAEPKEMALVSFNKYFDIPREEMEAKIAEINKSREENGYSFADYAENGELPNLDIIYTFDNDIINDYYRYE